MVRDVWRAGRVWPGCGTRAPRRCQAAVGPRALVMWSAVVLAEGVAFAGSVGAELGCPVAGVGLGLAGACPLDS